MDSRTRRGEGTGVCNASNQSEVSSVTVRGWFDHFGESAKFRDSEHLFCFKATMARC